jgi:poly(3-hydroxybutyrate) depolymerase
MALFGSILRLICLLLPSAIAAPSTRPREELVVMGRTGYLYKPLPCAVHRCIDPPKQAPAAIFVLHGSDEDASAMFDVGFEALADLHGFLVVYPEMRIPKSDEWELANDVPYFTALVETLKRYYPVAENQFFVCGHSAGGSMSTYLNNEVDLFSAAGSVEAAVGRLFAWDMSKRGHRTMVVWNHADPVLAKYAPPGGEQAYLNLTINTLRRRSSAGPNFREQLPLSESISQAELVTYNEDQAPQLRILHFTSNIGQHTWPMARWTTGVDAAEQLVAFFLELPREPVVHLDSPYHVPQQNAMGFVIAAAAGFVLASAVCTASKHVSSMRLSHAASAEPLLAVTV